MTGDRKNEAAPVLLGGWRPEELAVLERVTYQAAFGKDPRTIEIAALFQRRPSTRARWPDFGAPFRRLLLKFEGVDFLKLGISSGQIMGFAIEDLSARGLEDIRYAVDDYESGSISFQCRAISWTTADEVWLAEDSRETVYQSSWTRT